MAQVMFDVFGAAPYVVLANFGRQFIDANRSLACAFEDRDAGPFYDEYHTTIRNFVDEIRADNGGHGLLVDIHGTKRVGGDPADLYLGTLDGESTKSLLSRDPRALSRTRSLAGLLRQQGYVVSARTPETIRGGFTLETYGSKNPDGLDAIQIEIESALRADASKRDVFIEDLAHGISSLVARYADGEPLAGFRAASFLPRLPR